MTTPTVEQGGKIRYHVFINEKKYLVTERNGKAFIRPNNTTVMGTLNDGYFKAEGENAHVPPCYDDGTPIRLQLHGTVVEG